MNDRELRARQRAWISNPGDQRALAEYLQALHALGRPIPDELLAYRVFPAQTLHVSPELRASRHWMASAVLHTGEEVGCELTPDGLVVPEHTFLRFDAMPLVSDDLATQCAEIADLPFHGFLMERFGFAAIDLTPLARLRRVESVSMVLEGAERVPFATLATLPALRELRLRFPPRGPDDYAVLPPNLRRLAVEYAPALDDEVLERIAAAAPHLVELDLSRSSTIPDDAPCVSDRGLGALAKLEMLAHLALERCDGVTDAGVEHLAGLPLRALRLKPAPLTDRTLAALGRLEQLEIVEVRGEFGEEALGQLAGLPLQELDLSCPRLGSAATTLPASLIRLDLLGLWDQDDPTLEAIGHLSALEELTVELTTGVTDRGVAALGGLTRLRSLHLAVDENEPPTLTSAWARPLTALGDLAELEVGGRCDDAALAAFARLTGLRSLDVTGPFTGAGLARLASLTRLERLHLTGGSVGAGLEALLELSEVWDLQLNDCAGVDNDALNALAGWPRLGVLELKGQGPFTVEGLLGLAASARLYTLRLCRTSLRARAVERLRRELPDLRIETYD